MTDEESKLRMRLTTLLNSVPCTSIRFDWAGNHVSGNGYRYLAIALLEDGRDGHRGIAVKQAVMPKGVAARYQPDDNTLMVPTFETCVTHKQRMTLVHEMTHALIDEFGSGDTTRCIDHEICAYLACTLYSLHCAPDPVGGPLLWEPPPTADAVWKQAHALAKSVFAGDVPGNQLRSHDVGPLKRAILGNRHYRRTDREFTVNSGIGL